MSNTYIIIHKLCIFIKVFTCFLVILKIDSVLFNLRTVQLDIIKVFCSLTDKAKIKQSRYRPGVVQRVPGS